MKAQVEIRGKSLSLLFNNKMVAMCFLLVSQFIFGNSLVYTPSLKDSVGGYPANNPEFYISNNTVVTNRQQIFVKNFISKKEKVKTHKKEKTKRGKKKDKNRIVKISKSNISIKTFYLSDRIKRNILGNQYFAVSVSIDNFKKKVLYRSAFYCFIISFLFLLILKKHIFYIWGRALLLLIERNFTRPPPPFFILHSNL